MRKQLFGVIALVLALSVGMAGTAAAKSTFQTNPGDVGNEVQNVDLGGATGGTYTLRLGLAGNPATGPIAYNATAATVDAALEGLANIGAGNVSVAAVSGGYDVTFTGDLSDTNVDELEVANDSTTGGSGVDVTTTTVGVALHNQGIDFAVEQNGKQLTARSGPLAIDPEDYLCGGVVPPTSCVPPLSQPDKAGRVRLLFDEGVKINTGKFPACSSQERQQLENTTTAAAKGICGDAQVSIDGAGVSEAVALIAGSLIPRPVVTTFNGPKLNGNPTILLHARSELPQNTTLLDGELVKQGGRTLLDVQKIPPLGGGTGSLTDFFATLNAETVDKQAIKKAKKSLKKAKKNFKKAKKSVKQSKSKKAKKELKRAKKKLKTAKKRLKKAKNERVSFIEAKCTGGSYETEGTWNLGEYTDPTNLNTFQTNFVIQGEDSVPCNNNNNTAPFDPGPGR